MEDHLREIDRQAGTMFSQLVDQMSKEQRVTEALKASNQMKWVGAVDNIHATAREIV